MLRQAFMLNRMRRMMSTDTFKTVYTNSLSPVAQHDAIPAYRVMDTDGQIIDQEASSEDIIGKDECLNIYRQMLTLNAMDVIMFDAQRQGRISFYMTNYGEEATHFGAASALSRDDVIFGQYREAGVLMYRGFTLDEFMNQCYSNDLDYGKGRQMPVHYGSQRLNFHTISSPLGTQIPQAAGAAFAFKREQRKQVAVCYFGEGAASEGDFHYGLNFAATIGTPTLFICRNNGYAISTPSSEQFKGDGIASRGWGYGMRTYRVDGNDVLAMHQVVKEAREYATTEYKPVLIEAMTYRVGHHSTSDDSTAYRQKSEADGWQARGDNPIHRMRRYLERKQWWTAEQELEQKKQSRASVLKAFAAAEKRPKPHINNLFDDVLDVPSSQLEEQRAQMHHMIATYPDEYPTAGHAPIAASK